MDDLAAVGVALGNHGVTVVQYLAILWYMWAAMLGVLLVAGLWVVAWLLTRPA